jgi:rubrerythrin
MAVSKIILSKDLMDKVVEELTEYRAIGTVEEFKALKEKSEPKIPNYEGDGYYAGQIVLDTWICPNCEKAYEVDYEDHEYCPNCGQHIDHSSLTEDD